MKGLTAKVFRTYNASITFQEQLDKYTPKDGSIHEKLAAYNEANRMVAKLCNHQRAVPKSHGASMEKMANQVRISLSVSISFIANFALQIRALKYQRRKLRLGLLTTNPKLKKKHDVLAEEESDIDDEWIEKYEDETKDKDIEKAKKKFEKDNEKRAAEDEELLDQEVLDKKVEDINEEYERVKAERGTGKAELTGKRSEEALIAAVEKLDDRIKTAKLQMVDRDKGKEVSLTTR
jgi:DNA topoisomerase-1